MDVAHLHVFKAGGTTVSQLLREACSRVGGRRLHYSFEGDESGQGRLLPISQWFARRTPRSTILVTTQRDPMDRFRSAYF